MDHHTDLANFDSAEGAEMPLGHLRMQGVATETIDLSSLFTHDVYTSGSFDLSGIGSTSFGRLLDSLPLPVLLIDRRYCVEFANQACAKLSDNSREIPGIPFLNLLLPPRETAKVHELADKMRALLENAFEVRKPRTAEAILEMGAKKIWARLHIRSVRVGLERHLLVLIEDVTHEKKQIALNRRRDTESRRMREELKSRVQELGSELANITQRLASEIDDHMHTRQTVRNENRKMEIVCERTALATAVLTPKGAFKEMNREFNVLFGFDLKECPNFNDWVAGTLNGPPLPFDVTGESRATPYGSQNQDILAFTGAVACRDGSRKQVRLNLAKLGDSDFFLTCLESAPIGPANE